MWCPATLLALLFFQQPNPQAEGIKALEEQRYDAAIQVFSKAVEGDPKDYGARFHLALAYSLLNRDAEAIPEYQKVLELKPGLYEAELNLGMLLLRQKKPLEALPQLESASTKKTQEFRPAFYAGEAALAGGDVQKAEKYYKIAAGIDPKSAGAELGLARALAKQGRLEEAAPHFVKAAELDPGFQDALLELASLHEERKQTAQAIAIYRKFPEHAAARERLGELLLDSGDAAGAIPHLEFAVRDAPTAANRVALANAYVLNKEPEKSMPLLEQAIKSEPGDLDLRMAYARVLRDRKDYKAAAKEFYIVARAKPESAEAWSDLAAMLILLENYGPALAALDKVRELGAETPAHFFFRAIILDKHRQYEPALESYEKFLALSEGKSPDEEFKARQRIRAIKKELEKR